MSPSRVSRSRQRVRIVRPPPTRRPKLRPAVVVLATGAALAGVAGIRACRSRPVAQPRLADAGRPASVVPRQTPRPRPWSPPPAPLPAADPAPSVAPETTRKRGDRPEDQGALAGLPAPIEPGVVNAAFKDATPEVQRCLDAYFPKQMVGGGISVHFSVDERGTVGHVKVSRNELGNDNFAECVASVAERVRLTPVKGAPITTFNYTWSFRSYMKAAQPPKEDPFR